MFVLGVQPDLEWLCKDLRVKQNSKVKVRVACDFRHGIPGYSFLQCSSADCLDTVDECYNGNWLHAGMMGPQSDDMCSLGI